MVQSNSQTLFRRELDKSILDNIKLKIYNYLKYSNYSRADEVLQRMNAVKGLYVENLTATQGARMQARSSLHEIVIDEQFVNFDKNNNPIGLDPSLSKLIESQMGHELLHIGSSGPNYKGIMNSNNERGLNEGFTQLITENIFGYIVSNNSDGYKYFKKFAKILEATYGKSCILNAYFGDSLELKNRMEKIQPKYYDFINTIMTNAYYTKKIASSLEPLYDLITKDFIIRIIIPELKKKSPEEANNYIKNIAMYFIDNYKYAMSFLDDLEKYMKMNNIELDTEKNKIRRGIDSNNIKMCFYYAISKSDDVKSLVTFDKYGKIIAKYNNSTFYVNDGAVVDLIYSKLYEQEYASTPDKESALENKVMATIQGDKRITFSERRKDDIVYKKSVLAFFKTVAKKNGFTLTNSVGDLVNTDTIELDVINLKDNSDRFDFEQLREYSSKYELCYPDENNYNNFIIIDKATKERVENPIIEKKAAFAILWLSSFGDKWYSDEINLGETAAFSEFNKKIYQDMCKIISDSISNSGTINVDEIAKSLENGRSFSSVNVPLSKMFKHPLSAQIVYKYYRGLTGKNDAKLETETTKIYNSENVNYRVLVESRVNEVIPSSNTLVFYELNGKIVESNIFNRVKNNDYYYKLFVAAADALVKAYAIKNEIVINEAYDKLRSIEKNIKKENITKIDLNNCSYDQKIQYCLYQMRESLRARDIDGFKKYRVMYNNFYNEHINEPVNIGEYNDMLDELNKNQIKKVKQVNTKALYEKYLELLDRIANASANQDYDQARAILSESKKIKTGFPKVNINSKSINSSSYDERVQYLFNEMLIAITNGDYDSYNYNRANCLSQINGKTSTTLSA